MMRRIKRTIITMIVMALLFSVQAAYADSVLPSFSEMIGVSMPSLGEALKSYPDSVTENEDGSITELYSRVNEKDYETFGDYLGKMEAELGDYKVEGGVLTAEIRCNGSTCCFIYDNAKKEVKMTYPAGTYDKWTKNAEDHYSEVQLLLEEDRIEDALAEILMIPQYSAYAPVKELLKDNSVLSEEVAKKEEKLKAYRTIGSTVTFGRYEQNTAVDGKEDIEWIVLDYDENQDKALLISRYGLETINYESNPEKGTTWEACLLRNWLNDGFMREAFSEKEQAAILVTEVDNSPSQGYSEWPVKKENNTLDKVFCLSCEEARRYFNLSFYDMENMKARITATQHAMTDGTMSNENDKTADGEKAVGWWLRSPGQEPIKAASVCHDGSLRDSEYGWGCVARPALWLDVNAYLFSSDADE